MITSLNKDEIFVFGSNLAGIHGAGAAKYALKFGAMYGQGKGIQGNTYAIPTKDSNIRTLPLANIRIFVLEFLVYAKDHPSLTFLVTEIGCGLAGYTPKQIAPFFKYHTDNVILPESFNKIINESI